MEVWRTHLPPEEERENPKAWWWAVQFADTIEKLHEFRRVCPPEIFKADGLSEVVATSIVRLQNIDPSG